MAIPLPEKVSSLQAIIKTIHNDRMVGFWFTFLIVQPEVKENIIKITGVNEEYERLRKSFLAQRLLLVLLFGLIGYIVVTRAVFLVFICIFLLIPLLMIRSALKKTVGKISHALLSRDFSSEEISKQTLFQISEHYHHLYKIPSLVDKLSRFDIIIFDASCVIVILGGFVLMLEIREFLLLVLVGYFAMQGLLYQRSLYKYLG